MFGWLVLAGVLVGGAADDASVALGELTSSIHNGAPVRIKSELTLEVIPVGNDAEPHVADPVTAVVDWVQPGTGVFRIGEYDAFISNDEVIITRDGVDDAYLRCHQSSIPAQTIHGVFESCPFPMLALAFPHAEADRTAASFHPAVGDLRLVSATRNDRGQVIGMNWVGSTAEMTIEIDPETGRPVSGLLLQRSGPGIPEDLHVRSRWSWSYAALPEDETVQFVRGNRFRVDRLSALKRVGEESVSPGGEAPELRLRTLKGSVVDLAALRGRVVVIDFWATWCGPCRKALPKLQTLADEMAEASVTVLSVDCFERTSGKQLREAVTKMVDNLSLTIPVLLDETGETARRWGVQGIPATFVIGSDGRIVASHTGAGPDYLQSLRTEVLEALEP